MNSGWKKIVINGNAELHRSENCILIIKDNESNKIPVNQINSLIIESEQVVITSSLMVFLIENGVNIIFCDYKHNPCFETIPFTGNTLSSERLMEQIRWKNERKLEIGCDIIKLKIQNQANLLRRIGNTDFVYIESLISYVTPEDAMIIEAEAAKVYFRGLFGSKFHRRTESSINYSLNYGYALLLSSINRSIVSYGYNTGLGLNHHSIRNQFNFSCDIIEPFRPFVDAMTYENLDQNFDKNLKRKLLSIYSDNVKYNNSIISLETALDLFTLAVIKRMNDELKFTEVIDFA